MTILMLKDVPIAFPALAEAQSIGDGEPAFGGKFVIDPNSPMVAEIEAAMVAVAKQKWKDDWEDVLQLLKEEKKVCFERAPYRNKKTGKVYGGFEGKFNLGTRNAKNRPSVFDAFGKPIGSPDADLTPVEKRRIESLIYSGARTNSKVEFWAQDNTYGRRINCSLLGVMFAGDGERFGGGAAPASADDFAGLAKDPMENVKGSAEDAADVL